MAIAIGIFWLELSLVMGFLADARGRSFLGFTLISITLSPLIGIVIVLPPQ